LTVSWVSMVSSCLGQDYCVCIQYILVLYTVKRGGGFFVPRANPGGEAAMPRGGDRLLSSVLHHFLKKALVAPGSLGHTH
jgi:hypothetical protein